MSHSKVEVEEMADAIIKGLQEYADLATEDMKSLVKKSATSIQKEIKATAPVDTGKYKKSWRATKTYEGAQIIEYTVHSYKRYQLAHLLEKGHAKRGGGRTKAYPHIAPAEEKGEKELLENIEKALKG